MPQEPRFKTSPPYLLIVGHVVGRTRLPSLRGAGWPSSSDAPHVGIFVSWRSRTKSSPRGETQRCSAGRAAVYLAAVSPGHRYRGSSRGLKRRPGPTGAGKSCARAATPGARVCGIGAGGGAVALTELLSGCSTQPGKRRLPVVVSVRQLLRETIVNRTKYCVVKICKYIVFCVSRRSY